MFENTEITNVYKKNIFQPELKMSPPTLEQLHQVE